MADERLGPSGIRAVFDRALQLEAEGRSIVHLEIGRPHAPSPDVAIRAAEAALRSGAVHYTANRGTPDLREAIAADLERRGAGRYDPATELIVTAGGSEAVSAAFLGLLAPGDEVIVVDPAWPHYAPQVALARGRPVHVPTAAADGFQPDPDALAAAVTERTRMLVVSSPSNPTGIVIEPERLAAVAALCVDRDLVVLSDEIYREFVYGDAEHVSIASLPGMRQRTVIADSCSKTWSMTGWRVGWAAAPTAISARLNVVHQYLTVCAPSFAQAGAAAAVRYGGEYVRTLVGEYEARRRVLVAALAGHPLLTLDAEPRGAFYAFPRVVPEDADGTELARTLLEEAGIALVPGAVFGAAYPRHVRMSYAVSEATLDEAVARLAGVSSTSPAASNRLT